jgi:GxxExxY protein
MTGIIYKQESDSIIGACFELYNEKGCGFLESVYHECLTIDFGHYPKLEYECIAKTLSSKMKLDPADVFL